MYVEEKAPIQKVADRLRGAFKSISQRIDRQGIAGLLSSPGIIALAALFVTVGKKQHLIEAPDGLA